jgi:hypothetical protein
MVAIIEVTAINLSISLCLWEAAHICLALGKKGVSATD